MEECLSFFGTATSTPTIFSTIATAYPVPMVKRNQFGFNLGGPLYIPKLYEARDKTFVFGSYEGLRQQTPTTSGLLTVPTMSQRQGDFSHTFNPDGSPTTIYNPFTTRLQNGSFVR